MGSDLPMVLWRKRGPDCVGAVTWEHVRKCTDDPERWLEIFQRAEPDAVFTLATVRPKGKRGRKVMRGPGSEY